MKPIPALIAILLLSCSFLGQKTSDEVLATATGHTFTRSDLPQAVQNLWNDLPKTIAETRSSLYEEMYMERLLAAEARSRKTTPEALRAEAVSKVPAPAEKDIVAIYEANRPAFGEKKLDEVRKEIVAYLRSDPEQKAMRAFLETLRSKHQVVTSDINSPTLKSLDRVLSVDGTSVTAGEFDALNKIRLYNTAAEIYDVVKAALSDAVYMALVNDEAKAQNTDASSVLAAEVTGKLKDFTDEERSEVEDAFRTSLFRKYSAKIMFDGPAAPVQAISVDDDPAIGPVGAPVTVVMFSDFQCPACSATYPILKKVIAEFPNKIRFVVRDYPLINRHENAFQAALAANAANRQGKFWEYTPILYTHQDKLDKASLRKYAADLGLDLKKFEADMADPVNAAEIRKDMDDGLKYGVAGTPTIYVNGVSVRGLSKGAIRSAIERALKN